jgi:hypothetical protein
MSAELHPIFSDILAAHGMPQRAPAAGLTVDNVERATVQRTYFADFVTNTFVLYAQDGVCVRVNAISNAPLELQQLPDVVLERRNGSKA